ncbi:MAG TPA: response regulator [Aquabacterium sp.]|nr:response regulator [Aquabacterium sp.]
MTAVLLVHEDAAVRRCVQAVLTHQGHALTALASAQEAFDAALSRTFDLVVVSDHCVRLDHDSLPSLLRTAGHGGRVVVLQTVSSGGDSGDSVVDSDACLPDPGQSEVAWQTLLVDHLPQPKEAGRWDHLTFESLAGFDQLKARFMARLPGQLEALMSSWQTRDWMALTRQAHALKGSAACYGLDEVSSIAQTLERLARESNPTGVDEALSDLMRLTLVSDAQPGGASCLN